jgi:uncharacterized protein
MRYVRVRNETRGVTLTARAIAAERFWLRLRGLLGRPRLEQGEGLLITPCRAVHMMGMKYPIDVIFLDRDGRVLGIERELEPGAKSAWYRSARHALELPAGTADVSATAPGDLLVIESVEESKDSASVVIDPRPHRTLPGAA